MSLAHLNTPEQEWHHIVESVPPEWRQLLNTLVAQHAERLARHFYQHMLQHPQAKLFLHHDMVQQRLSGSMQRWLKEIFQHPLQDVDAIVAHQRHVGEVHARIQLPIHLVARGARLLKKDLAELLSEVCGHDGEHNRIMGYAAQLIDLALELMSAAYLRNTQRNVRTDEAYRLFSLGQNMSIERERQRSILLEWGQELLFTLHRSPGPTMLPSLSASEFGLWFTHKAIGVFEGAPELEQIRDIMDRVDNTLLPQLKNRPAGMVVQTELVMLLQSELDNLKFQLATLFERHLEVENGRDTLTRLLNRRFLPSVMNREIQLAHQKGTGFALLLLDIDHFKRINDGYGHDAGDMVLQQAAALLLNCVRNGDFIFRYGGEEILIMLVEVSPDVALRIAEAVRSKFETTPFLISQGRSLGVTVSIGVALYDGHPDHQFLIKRADEAMYRAKHQGRNQVCLAVG